MSFAWKEGVVLDDFSLQVVGCSEPFGAKKERSGKIISPFVSTLVIIALLVSGCSWFTGDPTVLRVDIIGFPEKADAAVLIEGEDGEDIVASQSGEYEVDPGDYSITINPADHGARTYYASEESGNVVVEEGATTVHVADYDIAVHNESLLLGEDDAHQIDEVTDEAVIFHAGETADRISIGSFIATSEIDSANGLLVRRVKAVEFQEGRVVAETEEVDLVEAMPKGVIELGDLDLQSEHFIFETSIGGNNFSLTPFDAPGGDSGIEFGFGGGQEIVKQELSDGKSATCGVEVPPIKFGMPEALVYPTGRLKWDAGKPPELEIYLNFKGSAEMSLEGNLKAKCSIDSTADGISVDRICEIGVAKIVRLGIVNLKCGAEVIAKANAEIPSGGVEASYQTDVSLGVGVKSDEKNPPEGDVYHLTSTEGEFDYDGPGFTLGMEMALEISLGFGALGIAESNLVIEQLIGIKAENGGMEVPFDGKMFLRSEAGVGPIKKGSEVQLFHWNYNIFEYDGGMEGEDFIPLPSPPEDPLPPSDIDSEEGPSVVDGNEETSRVEVGMYEYKNPEVVQRAIDVLARNEEKEISIAIDADFQNPEHFDVWPASETPELEFRDIIYLGADCGITNDPVDLDCPVLRVHLPEGVEAIGEEVGSNGVPFTFAGNFLVGDVVQYEDLEFDYENHYDVYLENVE